MPREADVEAACDRPVDRLLAGCSRAIERQVRWMVTCNTILVAVTLAARLLF